MKILNRYTKEVVFEDDFETIKETVVNAIRLDANLSYANLSHADLSDANLRGADLVGADLSYAKNIKSFQCGEYNRISYAVRHENKTMFKIGCFWRDANEAIKKVKEKYGEDSDYEKIIILYNEMMIKNK